jgi:hypothetical protein
VQQALLVGLNAVAVPLVDGWLGSKTSYIYLAILVIIGDYII